MIMLSYLITIKELSVFKTDLKSLITLNIISVSTWKDHISTFNFVTKTEYNLRNIFPWWNVLNLFHIITVGFSLKIPYYF